MTRLNSDTLRKALTEVVIIVVGILIALSADAWWQDRNERKAEEQHLLALRDDFMQSVELLSQSIASRKRQDDFLRHLIQDDAPSAAIPELGEWIYWGLFTIGSFEPQFAALSDLETSGEMRLIDDPGLRRSLAFLRQNYSTLVTLQADYSRSQAGLIDTFLVSQFDLAAILATFDPQTVGIEKEMVFDRKVLQAAELRNIIAFKLSLGKLVLDRLMRLQSTTERTLELIESRLKILSS